MKKFLLVLAACVIFSPELAAAAPVYLTCSFPSKQGDPEIIDFTMNEADGTASIHLRRNGFFRTHSATFTAEKVFFGSSDNKWTIDRTSLQVSSEVFFDNKLIHTSVGQCEINTAANRAF